VKQPYLYSDTPETVKRMYAEGKYIRDIADVFGVSRPTIYRVLEKQRG
jgi:transposase-like protein